jgi:hypothetical protein
MSGPDVRSIPAPRCGCDIETETCVAGACICAPEHTRVDGRCEPVLGGSYRPAAGCAAIREAYGAVPEVAWVDPDGTTPMARESASPTVRVRCDADGLGEVLPAEDAEGVPVFDVVAGRFEVRQLEVMAPPALFERRLTGADTTPPNVPPKPLMALEIEDYTLPTQRLFARFRNERIDLGALAVRGDGSDLSEHALVRDAEGRLCVTRRGVELVCRELRDEPLWLRSGKLLTEGLRCLPAGHDYGANRCDCDVRSCEEAAIACGGGNDGCFGRVACDTCESGLRCEAGRCLCESDADEREPTADDDAYLLRVGVDGAPFSVAAEGFTLDRAEDLDWVQIQAGDAAFATPNELRVVVRSSSDAPLSLMVGTAGCAVSCPVGELVNADWWGRGTGPGCRAEGVGSVEVVFRVACDPFTVDAERGLYLARIEAENDACMPWSIAVESRAASPSR